MLILTRRVGENVIVGDDIVISVLEVRGDAVRLGIQAPRSVAVHREEVWLELQQVNAGSASPTDDAVTELGAAVVGLVPKGDAGRRGVGKNDQGRPDVLPPDDEPGADRKS